MRRLSLPGFFAAFGKVTPLLASVAFSSALAAKEKPEQQTVLLECMALICPDMAGWDGPCSSGWVVKGSGQHAVSKPGLLPKCECTPTSCVGRNTIRAVGIYEKDPTLTDPTKSSDVPNTQFTVQNLAPVTPKRSNHFAVTPTKTTIVTTYYIQTENFSTELAKEFDRSLARLSDKCWVYSDVPNYAASAPTPPEYCLRFATFKDVSQLKPYRREATEKKMLLSAKDEDQIHVQNFVWDGEKLRRVRNSGSKLRSVETSEDRMADFIIGWAIK